MSPDRLSRKDREHQFRVDFVLDAALEVFMEQPYAVAKIDDIAARAELSVGTLYNLFESKEDIYKALVSRQQDRYFARADAQLEATDDPRAQIHVVVREFLAHVSENFSAWRFYVCANAGLSSTVRDQLFEEARQGQAAFMQRLTEVCRRGIGAGVFRSGLEPRFMALAILSVAESCTNLAFRKNDPDVMKLVPGAVLAAERIAGVE